MGEDPLPGTHHPLLITHYMHNEPTNAEPAPLVSVDEHEQGWKDVAVEFRSGRKAVWRIKAVPARKAQIAYAAMFDGEADALSVLALPDGVSPKELDLLTLESLSGLQKVMAVLAFGEGFQKKMETAALALAATTFDRFCPPNSVSPAADTIPPNSAPGASPSSGSISKNSTANSSVKRI